MNDRIECRCCSQPVNTDPLYMLDCNPCVCDVDNRIKNPKMQRASIHLCFYVSASKKVSLEPGTKSYYSFLPNKRNRVMESEGINKLKKKDYGPSLQTELKPKERVSNSDPRSALLWLSQNRTINPNSNPCIWGNLSKGHVCRIESVQNVR